MTAQRDAEYAFRLIKEYVVANVRPPYKYVRVKVASYATEKDFHAFKPGQKWRAYTEGTALLGKMCEDTGWQFDDSEVITAEAFDKIAKENGLIGDLSQRIDFVLTGLGYEIQSGAYQA